MKMNECEIRRICEGEVWDTHVKFTEIKWNDETKYIERIVDGKKELLEVNNV